MNTEVLQRSLASVSLVKQFYCYSRLDSTMNQARRLILDAPGDEHHGTLILTDFQNSGRGRNGRTWMAAPGQSILASLVLTASRLPDAEKKNHSTLIACAVPVAICHGLQKLLPGVRIKYPNDIVSGGRKIGGILLEACGNCLIVGFGINCLQDLSELPSEVRTPASSLFLETGLRVSREEVLTQIAMEFDQVFRGKNLNVATDDMNALCDTVGSMVCIDTGQELVNGFARCIDADGVLVMETSEGIRKIYSSQIMRVWPADAPVETQLGG